MAQPSKQIRRKDSSVKQAQVDEHNRRRRHSRKSWFYVITVIGIRIVFKTVRYLSVPIVMMHCCTTVYDGARARRRWTSNVAKWRVSLEADHTAKCFLPCAAYNELIVIACHLHCWRAHKHSFLTIIIGSLSSSSYNFCFPCRRRSIPKKRAHRVSAGHH